MLDIRYKREVQTMPIIYVIKDRYKEKDNVIFVNKEKFKSILIETNDDDDLGNLDCYYINTNESTLSMERLDMDTIKLIL